MKCWHYSPRVSRYALLDGGEIDLPLAGVSAELLGQLVPAVCGGVAVFESPLPERVGSESIVGKRR